MKKPEISSMKEKGLVKRRSSFQRKNATFCKIRIVVSLTKQGYFSLLEGSKEGHSLLEVHLIFSSSHDSFMSCLARLT